MLSFPVLAETPASTFSDEDVRYLSATMYGEARGEGEDGMLAVGSVILNRVSNSKFPNTVKKVVLQKGQFTVWNPSNPNHKTVNGKIPDRVVKLAIRLLESGSINHYLYFESASLGRRGVRVGRHIFLSVRRE